MQKWAPQTCPPDLVAPIESGEFVIYVTDAMHCLLHSGKRNEGKPHNRTAEISLPLVWGFV